MPRVGVTTCAVPSTARAGRRPAFQAGGAITALDRPTGLHLHSKLPRLTGPMAQTQRGTAQRRSRPYFRPFRGSFASAIAAW